MVLNLETQVGPDFLKDFPGVNGANLDDIDALAGPCLITHPLTAYTPVLSAVTTAPTLGTTGALLRGFYYRIFDQIYTWGEFRFGTGFAAGSGIYTISLPFPANSLVGVNTNIGSSPVVGDGLVFDDSLDAGRQQVTVHLRTTSQLMFGTRMNSGGNREVDHTAPITWAALDGITWFARYKRAS